MTDHFKDKKGQDGQSVRSFKEQILAELEEAHRLRRLREENLKQSNMEEATTVQDVKTVLEEQMPAIEEEPLLPTEDLISNLEESTDVSKVVTIHQLEDTRPFYQEEFQDLADTIPLNPLQQDLSLEEPVSVESDTDDYIDLDNLELDDSSGDLSLTRVMAGFNRLFDKASKAKSEDLDDDQDFQTDDVVSPEVRPVAMTQVTQTEELVLDQETGQDDVVDMNESQRRTHRVARKISLVLLGLLTLFILVTGFFVYRYVDSGIKPLDAKSTEYIQVEIPSGSGNKLIGKILEESGVIKSGQIFNYYVKFKNYTNFQSGFYNFQKSMSLDDIAKKLQEGGTPEPERPALGKILIPEGYTLEQIAKAVTLNANTTDKKDKTPFSQEDFMALVQNEAFIAQMAEKFPGLLETLPDGTEVKYRLEGYLFPATYSYYEETKLEDIVEQMLAAMDANLSPYYSTIANYGMTVNQVLTLASLVEKEGATDDDRKLIAGVFFNRWNQGMPLQSNIAILYAMGKLGESTTLLEDATIDTGIESPYNIYINPGLMPGPVDSPSLSAIKATINPEQSPYLYFVADVTTGAVYYAETYDEHSANVDKYINSHLTNTP